MKFSSSFRSSQNYKDSLMTFGTLSFGLRTRQLLATHAEVGYCKQNCRFRFFRLLIGSETIISPTLQIAPTWLLSMFRFPSCRYTFSLSQRARVYCNAMPNGLLGRLLVSCACRMPCSVFRIGIF